MAACGEILTPPKTPRKKYNLGSDVDKDEVFDFPFLIDEKTVSYIQEKGKVMFLIRGPPSTGKATLSDMLQKKYPAAAFCCADSYFKKSFDPPERNSQSIKESHIDCLKNAKRACSKESKTIIVQNTHMRKWEIQCYLDLAAENYYTVIMAITLYRFNVTAEALYQNSPDGLNLKYFQNRLRQWEDIPPVQTGWFLSPGDANLVKSLAFDALKELLHDGKFCRVYNFFDIDQIIECFKFRRVLCCLAGYSEFKSEMLQYYLGDTVQEFYGKCFSITILGYYVSPTTVDIIMQLDDVMQSLLFEGKFSKGINLNRCMEKLDIDDNLDHHLKVETYVPVRTKDESEKDLDPDLQVSGHEAANHFNTTAVFEDWSNNDSDICPSAVSFIHLGHRDDQPRVDIGQVRKEFKEAMTLQELIAGDGYTELENETRVLRLSNDDWIVKAKKKVTLKAVFTGMYV